ncbi:hypothetical protein EYF80_053501 [Liparis tanakae]|uniref:Uncharacterized protein n=1 Tax=Liparis tanakae TaxID=230148 RepID=A0A4Z2F643_9TELE|nr:hypothetical protein EYF80_053501 [Liparis tanakae]
MAGEQEEEEEEEEEEKGAEPSGGRTRVKSEEEEEEEEEEGEGHTGRRSAVSDIVFIPGPTGSSPSARAQLSAAGSSHSLLADITSREYLYSSLSTQTTGEQIAGEGDEEHGDEGSAPDADLQPQSDGLARRGAPGRQRRAVGAQLGLVPHEQSLLQERRRT